MKNSLSRHDSRNRRNRNRRLAVVRAHRLHSRRSDNHTFSSMSDEDTVCVIGAGVSGLVAAKVLEHDGFDVTVFEKKPTIGGVWAPSRAYVGLCTNNPRKAYAFSDFRYPETSDEFPTAGQVFEYLKSYVEHFGLESHLSLSTEVLSVARRTEGNGSHPGFRVTVRPVDGSADAETHAFDFVVICNGVFSEPCVPQLEGQERFGGSLIHSSQMVDRDMLSGKRVVVVGAGKSALDCASMAAREAASSTLVFRKPHWMLPRYFPGDTRVDDVFFTRFSEKILPAYYRASRFETSIRTVAAPFFWLWRRGMSWLVSRVAGMPPKMVPQKPVTSGAENIGIGTRFYEALRKGLVSARRAEIRSFSGRDTLQLETGEEVKADLVIFATGWRQNVSLLNSELREEVQRDGKFHLYRHILPPRERRLGFVGYASAGNNALTSEVAAHWLSQCFRQELKLPNTVSMEQEVARLHDWAAEVFLERCQGYFVGGYVASYVDELMRDMELPTWRTDSFFSEYFEPLYAERYRGLAEERRLIQGGEGAGADS